MRKSKILTLIVAISLCFCMTLFAGCTFSLPIKDSQSSIYKVAQDEVTAYETDFTSEDFTELTDQEKKQQIAEKYISISFTVLIYKVVETTPVGGTMTSEETVTSFGSGVCVYDGGYILTNNHVISDVVAEPVETDTTKTFYKCYASQDGGETYYEAKVLWNNAVFDMAIIICEEFSDVEPAVLKDRTIFCTAEEKISVLEQIVTVGTQSDLAYYATATSGEITSNLLRLAISGGLLYEHLIQHDAAINHGNSGGVLVDLDGNVIGLNTLGDDSSNSLFFAVSIYPAIAVLDKVVENYVISGEGTKDIAFGFSGSDADMVANSSDTSIDFSEEGLYTVEVEPTCIISGLQAGDVIKEINVVTADGVKTFLIKDRNTLLYARIALLYGVSATVKIDRAGVAEVLNITLD